jgi:outer membrane protein TolC
MNSVTETAFRNNYKFGMSLYYPLLLRKERGKLQMNTLKIYQTKQDITQTERDIINNIESTFNEYLTYSSQLIIQQEQVELTNLLLNGERDKFFNGESTLFLVNTREVTMINAELKQIDLRNKVSKTLSELYWSAGQSLLE